MIIFNKKSPPSGFYVYLYLRDSDSIGTKNGLKGTPYYVGKGLNDRAWVKHGSRIKVPTNHYICIIAYDLTDQQAKDLEKRLIAEYGRIDLDTGILMNLTEGGEGVYGTSEEVRAKRRKSQRETWAMPEAKAKKSEATRKVWDDPEYKAERSATIRQAWEDPELRREHAEKIKKTWSDPTLREEQSQRSKISQNSEEIKIKKSIKMKEYWNKPDSRIKASIKVKSRYENNPEARENASRASKEKWKKVTPEQWAQITAKRRETLRRKKEEQINKSV